MKTVEKLKKTWSFKSTQAKWVKVSYLHNVDFLNTFKIGLTANICCGFDTTGDILIDIDLNVLKKNKKQHYLEIKDFICADMFKLPLRYKSVDTIICDPPYNYYTRFQWIYKFTYYAKKRIILSAPTVNIRLPNWDREIYAISTPGLFLRLWFVFTNTT
jgi:23S rRNA G2445 N2-methylase RlmL